MLSENYIIDVMIEMIPSELEVQDVNFMEIFENLSEMEGPVYESIIGKKTKTGRGGGEGGGGKIAECSAGVINWLDIDVVPKKMYHLKSLLLLSLLLVFN